MTYTSINNDKGIPFFMAKMRIKKEPRKGGQLSKAWLETHSTQENKQLKALLILMEPYMDESSTIGIRKA